ncbi:LamG domain-containing protein [Micromonospora sp. LOL_013]|uniref:LamG domain-containing protein n=1 Tax=Micromonospora sp. LOL_013 TaxID=3345414 RepID=UPI003A8AFC09
MRTLTAIVLMLAGVVVLPSMPAEAEAPEPQCVDQVATSAEAERIALACAARVEALDERDEYSQVYVEPDGTRTLESAVVPQRIRTGTDSWVPVSTDLAAQPDGRLAPAATTANVTFSGGGTAPLVTLEVDGEDFTLSWPDPLPTPTVQADTAVYASVLPDVDLHVMATATGFKHVLEVKTAQAAAHPDLARVRYILGGDIAPEPLPDGGLRLANSQGRTVGVTPTASMWDSSVDPANGGEVTDGGRGAVTAAAEPPEPSTAAGPGPAAAKAAIDVDVAAGDLEVLPDPAVLNGPETIYPVFIDPAFENKSTSWAYANNSNNNWDVENQAWVGRNPYDDVLYRSYFRFNIWPVRSKQILSAEVRMRLDHSWSCSPTWVHLFRTAGINDTPRMSWGARPLPTSAYLGAQDANANEAGGCGVIQDDVNVEFGGSAVTNDVQYSVNQQWSGYTVGLCACNPSGQYEWNQDRWKRFYVDQSWLIVNYNSRPGTPTELTTSAVACNGIVGTTSPTLRARYRDSDESDTLVGTFEWRQVGGGATLVTGPSRPANNFGEVTLNLGAGAEGKTYAWRVRANDSHADSDWSTSCQFTVNASAPPAPGISSTTYPSGPTAHGGPGESGTFTFTAGATDVTTYVYGWSNPPSNQVTVSPGASHTVALTPPKHGTNVLYVFSKDSAGTPSPTAPYQFLVGSPSAPIGHWPLDTVNGHGLSDVVGDADLTATGDVTWPGDTRLIGESVPFFDSVTESPTNIYGTATANVPELDTAGSFSVTAWVRASSLTTGNRTAVSQDDSDFSGFYLGFRYLGNPPAPYWSFMMGDSPATGTNHRADSTVPLTTADVGKWTHLTAVHDAELGMMRLYVNGELAAETTRAATPWTSTGPLVVGRALWYGSQTDTWRGEVTDLRIWDRVLVSDDLHGTNTDPQAGTQATPGILAPTSVGDWDFAGSVDCWCDEAFDVDPWSRHIYLQGWDSDPPGAAFTNDGHDENDAAWFDGVGGYASTTDPFTSADRPVIRTDQSFTVSAWLQLDGDPSDPLPTGDVVAVAQGGAQADAFLLGYQAATEQWAFWMQSGDTNNAATLGLATSAVTPVPGEWFHLVGVYDAGSEEILLYVNGQPSGAVSLSSPMTWFATGSLTLARERWNGGLQSFFSGSIDQVTVYAGVVNPRLVLNLYSTL